MMELELVHLPQGRIRGTYDVNKNNVSDDYLPRRLRYLHPDAARSANEMKEIVWSDMFRSAEASLAAIARGKRGVQPPAFSGHNFGFSGDVDIRRTLRENNWTYADLLNYMVHKGWYCYRRDGKRGREDWHFNHLGHGRYRREILEQIDPRPWLGRRTWKLGAELMIQKQYGDSLTLSPLGVQDMLQRLRLYKGDLDGSIGPISQQAIKLFARTWKLKPKHINAKFQRVLAYVSADTKLVELV